MYIHLQVQTNTHIILQRVFRFTTQQQVEGLLGKHVGSVKLSVAIIFTILMLNCACDDSISFNAILESLCNFVRVMTEDYVILHVVLDLSKEIQLLFWPMVINCFYATSIKAHIQKSLRWCSRLEHSLLKRKDECSNPSHDRPES